MEYDDLNKFEIGEEEDDILGQTKSLLPPLGLSRRLSKWREEHVARRALVLAGQPGLVLDLPSDGGRFWPLLAEKSNRIIIAADSSSERLEAACRLQPQNVVSQVRPILTSVFDIGLPENAVDSIFCMRLMHLIGEHEQRVALLREFHRITRDSVVISLWVDGNFRARRRLNTRRHQAADRYHPRFVIPREVIEHEFAQAGFQVDHYIDIVPFYAMCRVYVLHKI